MDALRLAVAPTMDHGSDVIVVGFHVEIHINGEEMTSRGAGLGMDTYDLLVPHCRLTPGVEPRTVPVARCGCGVYGCGRTDVTITAEADRVYWDWLHQTPMDRRVVFDRSAYDAELARVTTDHSWETPERRAGRFVLERLPRDHLARFGLEPDFVGNAHPHQDRLQLCLRLDDSHQIFVSVPWRGRTPDAVASELIQQVRQPPAQWTASWHALANGGRPPAIAGADWSRCRF